MNKKVLAGLVFILLGAYLFFFRNVDVGVGTLFGQFWAIIFVLPVGLFFHWMYFSMTNRRGPGLLIPGGTIVITAIVCQIATLFDSWQYLWPGFVLAPAVGLFEFYWFTNRNKYLLIPIYILFATSLVFSGIFSLGALYNRTIFGQPLLATILVVLGVALVFIPSKKRDDPSTYQQVPPPPRPHDYR
jgi:hypothetical protein